MEDRTEASRTAEGAEGKRKRASGAYKERYLTMRGWVVVLAVTLATVVFGVAVRGFFS